MGEEFVNCLSQQARGFFTKLNDRDENVNLNKKHSNWHDCDANDQYVLERSVIETCTILEHKNKDTCVGKGTIVGQRNVNFQIGKRNIRLNCDDVPDFGKNMIALFKLVPIFSKYNLNSLLT